MTKIYLVTGFLGSGKTSFLNHYLQGTAEKVGVLMNEFGAISMDTVALEHDGMSFKELKNGSIFCACLKDYFIDGIKELVLKGLDAIYIESSGLSDPSDMGKVLEVLDKTVSEKTYEYVGAICMVDGKYFKAELEKMVSVERQIRHSHTVVINKIDLITLEELQETVDIITELNPRVCIVFAKYGVPEAETDFSVEYFYIEDEETTNKVDNKPKNVVLEFKETVKREELETFLDKISGDYFRTKGYLQLEGENGFYKVDSVNEQVVIKAFNGQVMEEAENKLVCLASKGILSISALSVAAGEVFSCGFSLSS